MGLVQPLSAAAADKSVCETTAFEELFRGQHIQRLEGREWVALYTKSRQEKALAQYLYAKRVPHYLPLRKKQTVCRGRRLTSVVPLFGGYLFLYGNREDRVTALQSNRVARTIEVASVLQEEFCRDLAQIQQLIDAGVPVNLESQIQPGERVRVKTGRLAGLEGVVTRRRGGWRLLIAVNYLQQGASVEIDDFAVEVV